MKNLTQAYLTELTYKIIGCCIEVHKVLGPGLLESIYVRALQEEFRIQGIKFRSEFHVPIFYKEKELGCDLRCDFLVEDCIVLEIKAVTEFHDIHKAQTINYMNILKIPKGILINFNVMNIFKEGQKTFVNEYFTKLPDK